ncbi:hypothetical protein SCA6_001655 [Theobroma cacao]
MLASISISWSLKSNPKRKNKDAMHFSFPLNPRLEKCLPFAYIHGLPLALGFWQGSYTLQLHPKLESTLVLVHGKHPSIILELLWQFGTSTSQVQFNLNALTRNQ